MKSILAINNKGYIAKDGKLMWRSKDDFAHFRKMTMGGVLLVGNNTFKGDLRGKPLKGRQLVVIGRHDEEELDYTHMYDLDRDIYRVSDLHKAMALAVYISICKKVDTWVVGGKSIYESTWPFVKELHLSIIDDDQVGDMKVDIPLRNDKITRYYFKPDSPGKE